MNRQQKDGLLLVILGCLTFVALGILAEQAYPARISDFRGLYFPGRSLLMGHDPYDPNQVMLAYRADAGEDLQQDTENDRRVATQLPYPPTVFAASLPFAFLPRAIAQLLWITATAALVILAASATWISCAKSSPIIAGLAIAFILANSQLVMIGGNPAGLATCLCAFAGICFLTKRFETAAIVCMALSLAIKPQDTGLVWLGFFLAGASFRRRAIQAMAVCIAICAPIVIWVTEVAPHWWGEWLTNIGAYTARGGINDPGALGQAHGLLMVVSLEAVFSILWDNPRFYNLVSVLVCLPVLFIWLVKTVRSPLTSRKMLLSLAVLAGLTMLPVYHRQYDTLLLLLTIPACARLWSDGTTAARTVVGINCVAIVLNGNLTWVVILVLLAKLHPAPGGIGAYLWVMLQTFPAPLSLLASAIAFLWLYVRSGNEQQEETVQAPASAQA